ncbi:MAG: DUF3107 family protein [Acidimicrobiia bacterium]|nr:DUF3107 family protein [Acidimicrobiia bacterium]
MDVRIGVIQTAREIQLELAPGTDAEELRGRVADAITGKEAVLWLVDRHGHTVAVAGERIAYVEIGAADGERRVGFGAA